MTDYPLLRVIDLETCGTDINAAILSIGGVTVYYDQGWRAHNGILYEEFDVADQVEKGATFDPATLAFHLKGDQTAQTLRDIMGKKRDSLHNSYVLNRITEWWFTTAYGQKSFVTNSLFVCRGTDFDPPILREAFKRYGLKPPFTYGRSFDLRTVETMMTFLGHPIPRAHNDKPHHASFDAIEEAHQLTMILNLVKPALDQFEPVVAIEEKKDE